MGVLILFTRSARKTSYPLISGKPRSKQNNIVIVYFAEAHAFLSKVGLENVKAFGKQHQLDALSGCAIVFDKKHSHGIPRLLQV